MSVDFSDHFVNVSARVRVELAGCTDTSGFYLLEKHSEKILLKLFLQRLDLFLQQPTDTVLREINL